MRTRYFQCVDDYLAVTNETPSSLSVGRGPLPGKGLESVCEQAYSTHQMEQWCEVSADEAPDDWFEATGLEEQPSDLAFIDNVLYEIPADEGFGIVSQ